MEYHATPLGGAHGHLLILRQHQGGHQGRLVGIGAGELFTAGLSLVGGQLHPGGLTVFKEKQQMGGIVPRRTGPDKFLVRVHAQLGGQVVPQYAGLAVVKIR